MRPASTGQLADRCARQGNPGSFRQFLALGDEILTSAFGSSRVEEIKRSAVGEPESSRRLARLFRSAQRKVQHGHFRDRQLLMHYVKKRKEQQTAMGQDPYLDTPGN